MDQRSTRYFNGAIAPLASASGSCSSPSLPCHPAGGPSAVSPPSSLSRPYGLGLAGPQPPPACASPHHPQSYVEFRSEAPAEKRQRLDRDCPPFRSRAPAGARKKGTVPFSGERLRIPESGTGTILLPCADENGASPLRVRHRPAAPAGPPLCFIEAGGRFLTCFPSSPV